jgi:hypothetical protein
MIRKRLRLLIILVYVTAALPTMHGIRGVLGHPTQVRILPPLSNMQSQHGFAAFPPPRHQMR